MNMAKSLIGSMTSKWQPEKYKDDYREALMDVIEEKVEAGGKEIEEKPRKAPKPTKVIDLVSVLQKSLEQSGAKEKAKAKSRAKKAHLPGKQHSCSRGRLTPVAVNGRKATGLTSHLDIIQPNLS